MRVENGGSIRIGDYLNINSSWVPTELRTARQGRIQIGDDVLINFGTVIAAGESVSIGDGAMIGPHCIISDVDIPDALPEQTELFPKPVEIGERVWLAARVTVRPGVRIGAGAVVAAGSIVERDIPPNVMAIGIPARPLPKWGAAPEVPFKQRGGRESGEAAPRSRGAQGSCPPEACGALVSDFNLDELVYELGAAGPSSPLSARVVGHRSLAQSLAAPPAPEACGFAFIWTRPEAAVPEYARLMSGERVAERELLAEVDAFCAEVERCATHYRYVLVATWIQPSHLGGHPVLDGRPGGPSHVLTTLNLRLMSVLGRRPNIFVLNSARWQASVGSVAHNPRAWYLDRFALARPVMIEAARDIRALLATLHGRHRKLLVLASDDAFWQPPTIGSGSALGEAWVDFQAALDALRRRGVLLAIVGSSLPERPQRTQYFAVATEADEVAALQGLVASLHVSFDEVVYLDAREALRKRVRAAIPGLHVPDWPNDRLLYPSALQALRCLGTAAPIPDRRVVSP
jgi:acetyltransferase-like isoleucine patch superfamily enzyme